MFKKQSKAKTGGQILLILQEELFPNPYRVRSHYDHDSLECLADSIRKNGVLQPLHVRPLENGYQLIMGERRLRAARMAGLLRIPCIVMNMSDKELSLLAAIENIQRKDASFFDESRTIDKLLRKFDYTYEELSTHLGLSRQELLDMQRLLKIPLDLQEQIREFKLSKDHALLLLRLANNEQREIAIKEISRKKFSIRQTEELIREMLRDLNGVGQASKILYKDVKIFTNTIDHAIETMKTSGLSAETMKKESKNSIEYTIKISLLKKEDKKKSPSVEIQLVK